MRSPASLLAIILSTSIAAALAPAASVAQEPTGPSLSGRLEAAITRVGERLSDPWTLRQYVSERIAYEPYDGVLKGAAGTYLSGSADDADQALLLQALLTAADPRPETRFAWCRPDEELARALADEAAAEGGAPSLALDEVAAARDEIDDQELLAAIDEVLAMRAQARADSADAAARLEAALEATGYAPPPKVPAGFSQHTWLQALIDDTWVDLDTTSADGSARCPAEATAAALPEAMHHHARFSLVEERRGPDGLSAAELLTADHPFDELTTARVSLLFGEPAGLLEDPDPSAASATFTPLLRIDGESHTGTPLSLPRVATGVGALGDAMGGLTGLFDTLPDGSTTEEATDDPGGGLFGGLGDALAGAESSDDPASAETGSELTGLWLDVALLAPDGTMTTVRHELLDRIGVVARADGTARSAELAPLAEVDGGYALTSSLWEIGLLSGPVAASDGVAVEPLAPDRIDSYAAQLDALLRTFPAIRADLGGTPGALAVLVARLTPGAGVEDEVSLTFDALHVPASGPLDGRAAARDAVAVLGAERFLGALAGDTDAGPDDSWALLDAAWDAGPGLAFLTPADAGAGVVGSPQAIARMRARLVQGFSLLVPPVPVTVGDGAATAWWLIDPTSGIIRDEHENGLHTESTEYTILEGRTLTTMERFRRFGCRVARPVATAAMLLFMATGASPVSPLFEPLSEVAEAATKAAESEAERKAAEDAACSLG